MSHHHGLINKDKRILLGHMCIIAGKIYIRSRSLISIILYRYLLVKRNDSVTYFNERFINYGFNKISYVETLRLEGIVHFSWIKNRLSFLFSGTDVCFWSSACSVFLLFAMIIRSKYQKSHVSKLGQGNYITNSIYMQRLKVRTRGRQNVLPICKGHHSMLTVLQ